MKIVIHRLSKTRRLTSPNKQIKTGPHLEYFNKITLINFQNQGIILKTAKGKNKD